MQSLDFRRTQQINLVEPAEKFIFYNYPHFGNDHACLHWPRPFAV